MWKQPTALSPRSSGPITTPAIPAAEPGSAFVPVSPARWQDALCVQEERVVANDNTVVFQGLRLQLPRSRLRPHFVKAKVRVHQYCDGTHAIFHGPQCLARYAYDGENGLLKPLGTHPVDMWTTQARCPHGPQVSNSSRSGQLMCYLNRTTQFAIYRTSPVDRHDLRALGGGRGLAAEARPLLHQRAAALQQIGIA